MNEPINYVMWSLIEKMIVNIAFIVIIFKVNKLSFSQKRNIIPILIYFIMTLGIVIFGNSSWYIPRFVFDVLLAIYLAKDKLKTIYYILIMNILLEFLGYVFLYCSFFVYDFEAFVLYMAPVLLSFILWGGLYCAKVIPWVGNNIQIIFNGAILLGWIIVENYIFRYVVNGIGLINHVYVFIVIWLVGNIVLSRWLRKNV